MFFAVKIRKSVLFACALALLCAEVAAFAVIARTADTAAASITEGEIEFLIENICEIRNRAMLDGDLEAVRKLYDESRTNGRYAYDHETKKIKYLANWSEKQGITFTGIESTPVIKWYKKKSENCYTVNMLLSTEYSYAYNDATDMVNVMRIGTYHELDIEDRDGEWLITREWYTDPFADSLDLEDIKADDILTEILSHGPREFNDMNERRIAAVDYADKYVGAADSGGNGYSYNKQYKSYNNVGGDCANFISQVLVAGGFKKTGTWNYDKDGSRAWLKAQGLKDFMLYSGRGSLIVSGSYSQVLALSYKLLPGDIVAYAKEGKIAHVSVVTGADSRGYALVNCHNTDRYRVPWDLGWSNTGIKFYLIRVNY